MFHFSLTKSANNKVNAIVCVGYLTIKKAEKIKKAIATARKMTKTMYSKIFFKMFI